MIYDKNFNNTLAIWAALGGKSNIEIKIPILNWQKINYKNFKYTQYSTETKINVYDNGNAKIAVYNAKTPYMSYWNKTTKQWTIANVSWWQYGKPEILYANDGVFLAKIVDMANIIASFDGITWHNAGYCENAYNVITCGAYDINTNCSIINWWYRDTPLYYNYNPLTERNSWILANNAPVLKYVTSHKGNFIGIVSGNLSIAKANSTNPNEWITTIPEDAKKTNYMFIRSVHEKLFVLKWHSTKVGSDNIYYVNLCVLSDDATQLIETNLLHIGDLTDNRISTPLNIIWMEEWGKYVLFTQNMLYTSIDGINWEGKEQPTLTNMLPSMFEGSIYVPGDGFYISCNESYTYYAKY